MLLNFIYLSHVIVRILKFSDKSKGLIRLYVYVMGLVQLISITYRPIFSLFDLLNEKVDIVLFRRILQIISFFVSQTTFLVSCYIIAIFYVFSGDDADDADTSYSCKSLLSKTTNGLMNEFKKRDADELEMLRYTSFKTEHVGEVLLK